MAVIKTTVSNKQAANRNKVNFPTSILKVWKLCLPIVFHKNHM